MYEIGFFKLVNFIFSVKLAVTHLQPPHLDVNVVTLYGHNKKIKPFMNQPGRKNFIDAY
jgi:hypothetical protein